MTYAEALEGFLIHLRSRQTSPLTIARYLRVHRRFAAYLEARGITTIDQLKPEHLRLFVLSRLAQVQLVTAHYEVTPIKSFTSWLSGDMELLSRDPFAKVKKPRLTVEDRDVLRPDEVKRLLAVFDRSRPDEARDYLIVKLILATGLRAGEVLGAQLDDLDVRERWLRVTGKGRRERRVPLPDDLVSGLWAYTKKQRARYARSGFLFVSRTGGRLDGTNTSARFKRYVERAGIERRATLQGLRHWAATAMISSGMQMELVSRCLGHADSSITSRVYSHVRFADVQAAHVAGNPLRLVS